MAGEFHQEYMEQLFSEYCDDYKMDPKAYLENESKITNMLIKAMTEFRATQQERAKRFVLIYEFLDRFDPQKVYDKIRLITTKSGVLGYFYEVTAEFVLLYKDGDDEWIKHKNYKHEFFESFIPGEICAFDGFMSQRYNNIIRFQCIFDLKKGYVVETDDEIDDGTNVEFY